MSVYCITMSTPEITTSTADEFIRRLQEKRSLTRGKPITLSDSDLGEEIDLVRILVNRPSSSEKSQESSSSLIKEEVESEPEQETLELDKPRCLLVSDGYVLCCLELKNGRRKLQPMTCAADIPPLPKAGIIKLLLEEGYPVSVGLFKLGVGAYIIGGQEDLSGYPDPSTIREASSRRLCPNFWKFRNIRDPWGIDLYKYLAAARSIKGSSRDTFRLSKADGTLSLMTPEKCKIPSLNKPKIWPTVEKIGGLIHVMDSIPWTFGDAYLEGRFTHEVLNPNDLGKGWTEIPTDGLLGTDEDVHSHLVVGDHIYSMTSHSLLVFDLKTKKWEKHPGDSPADSCIFVNKVWQLLHCGHGSCLGEFLHHGEPNEPLYMVIAIMEEFELDWCGAHVAAIAYLASSTGQVLCYQRLPHFIGRGPPQIYKLTAGTVFNVDEQEHGSMMCSVVNGCSSLQACCLDILLINMFVVEAIVDAGAKVREILGKARGPADRANKRPVELEFVRVVVKERYVYKTDTELEEKGDLSSFPRVQACFL